MAEQYGSSALAEIFLHSPQPRCSACRCGAEHGHSAERTHGSVAMLGISWWLASIVTPRVPAEACKR
eukprot:15127-Chlamydomonas_euryale.AAC.6